MPQGEREEPCPTDVAAIEQGIVHPRSRTCRGCLFYSSFLRDSNQNPTCYGFSRSIPQSYRMEERNATKEFKYACLGYGLHKEVMGTGGQNTKHPDGFGELPLCVGIEFLADRRPVNQTQDKEEADANLHHNPLARPGAAPSEDFTSRFYRSASRIATAVVNNVIRVAGAVGNTVTDIFSSDDGKGNK